MSEKRKDSRGRLLREGESQRKDGKYEYKYRDINGIRRSVYSWRLVKTDVAPSGKRDCAPLRDMEHVIAMDIDDTIDTFKATRLNLDTLWNQYIQTRIDLKDSTRAIYVYMYGKYVKDYLGGRSICSIKYSDIKKRYIEIINSGLQYNTVKTVHAILSQTLQIAVRDGIIRTNPTDGAFLEVKRVTWTDRKNRQALTVQEQNAFMTFVSETPRYKRWYNLFVFLLGTGCRIGEATGIRWSDCDFDNGLISINHSLAYRLSGESMKVGYHVGTPKTVSGRRQIPMLSLVRNALLNERDEQMKHGFTKSEIDGYSGFIFHNKDMNVLNDRAVNDAIRKITRDYNAKEADVARKENRAPILLPYFTAHNLRHTFCTRFCENENNIKVVQEIMGHSDASITMNIYNNVTTEKKLEAFEQLDKKIHII